MERNNYNYKFREQSIIRNCDRRNSKFEIRDNSFNRGRDINNKDRFRLRTPKKYRDRPKHKHKNLLNIINKDKLGLLYFIILGI